MKTQEPTHGFCAVCHGRIDKGMNWTLTSQMHRVHSDSDDCIAVLRPKVAKEFMKANPNYVSSYRYTV